MNGIDPGWLFVGISGVAAVFFLIKVRQDQARKRHEHQRTHSLRHHHGA